jgi:hypothetical protein
MSQYDPFSYGQVQVGKKPADKASSPDDMLFADAGAPRPEPKEDSSWALLKENNVDNLLPGGGASSSVTEFGRDILGEISPASAQQPRAGAGPGKPVAARKPKIAAAPQPPAARPTLQPARAPAPAAAAPVAEAPAPPRAAAPVRPAQVMAMSTMPIPRRRVTPASVLVPLAVLAAGGGAAAWFHYAQQNVVMAAITGVTALVGAALAWVILRR